MASYQIPQFIDSGEKIFLGMNVRQFAYALAGFFGTVLIFVTIQNTVAGIGWYAIIPAIPLILFSLYLSMGKFNGRDSEIYVLKGIIYFTKPREMKYQRRPDYTVVSQKLAELTPEKILTRWNRESQQQNQDTKDQVLIFQSSDTRSRASQIRKLGRNVIDNSNQNIAELIRRKEITAQHTDEIINAVQNLKRGKQVEKLENRPVNAGQNEFATNFFENEENPYK
jgi:PrgI family protein